MSGGWRQINGRLRSVEYADLEDMAKRTGISVSAMVRAIVVDAIIDERERLERLAARESAGKQQDVSILQPQGIPSPVPPITGG